ncbi:SIS domain-containing protein [Aestuariimicrobium ganziense]|uniref:SIS domain-containing protein n=1 Tax=Aestuariimicrobium ganziense TaxID=2773677 RepID=UPI0019436705|nr:SIS domain-containing protein [Aestuariimicrobium ganziense]
MDHFGDEIAEQPEALRRAAAGLRDHADGLRRVREWVTGDRRPLVLTGMGSSFDVLLGLDSRLRRAGVPSVAVHTAELLNSTRLAPGSVVLAVSQSGLSAELVRLLERLGEVDQVSVVGITKDPGSPTARRADVVLPMSVGPEHGPSTKSVLASIVVCHAIEQVLVDDAPLDQVLDRVEAGVTRLAARVDEALGDRERTTTLLRDWVGEVPCFLLARGQGITTAEVAALVMKEAGMQVATAMDAAEFRHGPLELAGPGLAVAVISTEPSVAGLDEALLHDLAGHGTRLVQISTLGEAAPDRTPPPWPLVHMPGDGSLLDAALALVPMQLLVWALAHERSSAPGEFIKGAKTTTKE